MLAHTKIISVDAASTIVQGLAQIKEEINSGKFPWRVEYEDLHMNIEARLFELIGEPAKQLHTARSRNDQVSTVTRMYVRDTIKVLIKQIHILQGVLLELSDANRDVILPGYTHLQRAQPILLAHHFLAYVEMFQRDIERFQHCLKTTNVLTLGSGALAGVPYPIDREFVARELEFPTLSRNSLDAVSDRDYLVDYLSAIAISMMHCSRMAEEIILWSSEEFQFIQLASEWTTGSSIMPQKRNPDFAELARGKTGRAYGNLMGLLTMLKGLPLSYNRDLQEDKESLFDSIDTLGTTLTVFEGMLKTSTINKDQMERASQSSFMLATDVADYLVRKGLPFRQAHEIAGSLCDEASRTGHSLQSFPLKEYLRFSDLFDSDIYEISPSTSVSSKRVVGGTAPDTVLAEIKMARKRWGKFLED